jgi:hypothetical protein
MWFSILMAPILTMVTVFVIKSLSKAYHPMVLFVDNLKQRSSETGEDPLSSSEADAMQEQLCVSDPGFRIGHVHDLKLDLILDHYPFVGQFCGCCVRSSLWQTMKGKYPTGKAQLHFVLAQTCVWDNYLTDNGLAFGSRGELAGGKYMCFSCRNSFEEVPVESCTSWLKQMDQPIILLAKNSDVYGSGVPNAPSRQGTTNTVLLVLRKFKDPSSLHIAVQKLPFTLERTRAANGTWKLEPKPNDASQFEPGWSEFSQQTKEARHFLKAINGVNLSETKYSLFIDNPKEAADSDWKQLEKDLVQRRKKGDLTLTFSTDRSIMKVLYLNKGENHGITFQRDSTRVKSYDGDDPRKFDDHSLHAVIDVHNTTHRAKEESCRRDLGEFLNETDNAQLPRPIRLVFKPCRKELDWNDIAMKVVRLSCFLAKQKHWKLKLCSEWIMPIVRAVAPVLMFELSGSSDVYSMLNNRGDGMLSNGAIEVMACISTFFWTRVLLCALDKCRLVYLEQAEAQKILSVLYQKSQHNHMPYEAWLESLQVHVGKTKNRDAAHSFKHGDYRSDIQELIEAYNMRPGEPLLDFTHPSQGRMHMWMYSMCRSTMRVQHKIHQARCTTVVGVLLVCVLLMTVIGFSRHCKCTSSIYPYACLSLLTLCNLLLQLLLVKELRTRGRPSSPGCSTLSCSSYTPYRSTLMESEPIPRSPKA